MKLVYDDEDMRRMEKKQYRRKKSNTSAVEFDFRATETSNFRRHT